MIFGKHINKYYLKYGPALLLGIIALIVVDYTQLKIPEFYRMMINGMNNGTVTVNGVTAVFDMNFLLDRICRPMIFIVLSIIIGRFIWRVTFFGSAIGVETGLRDEMFDHVKDLSQQYYQVHKTGDLMSLFTNDLETIQDSFGNGVLMFFDAAVLGSMTFVKMLRMNPGLTILVTIPIIIMFLVCTRLSAIMNKRWDKRQAAFSLLSDYSQETFSGIAVVKAFAKEMLQLHEFSRLNRNNETANVDYIRISTLLKVIITLSVESIVCVILGYGGYLVHKGIFDPGMLVEFIGYFTSIVWPVMAISMLVEMASKGKASLNRVSEMLDAKIDVCDDPSRIADTSAIDSAFCSAGGEIEFKNLSFSYPGSPSQTLHDLSFHIKAGESIGILGKTGSGKTTIVDLIARTYNVPDGTLFINGIDVNKIPIRTLREHLAYVPQDNFLFSDSIYGNISFSLNDSSLENEVLQASEEAAKLADVHDNIIEFPEGYRTVLGERGVTVSGGQKQRISIARALFKDAQILILDDSVSAVDTKTERAILGNLKKSREGMTTLLIAHRISTIKQMDRILFIDDGRLVDFGSHDELLARCPEYARMVELQKLEEEESASRQKELDKINSFNKKLHGKEEQ